MRRNLALKAAIVGKFGTQFQACRRLGIQPSRLSQLCRGQDYPSDRERKILSHALGETALPKLLKTVESDRQAKLAGEVAK
jgi:transcriptional regulator with XRE-family HTH domain